MKVKRLSMIAVYMKLNSNKFVLAAPTRKALVELCDHFAISPDFGLAARVSIGRAAENKRKRGT